jgi:hypothetical protein
MSRQSPSLWRGEPIPLIFLFVLQRRGDNFLQRADGHIAAPLQTKGKIDEARRGYRQVTPLGFPLGPGRRRPGSELI